MSLYQIKYKIKSDKEPHRRFYHALDKDTAISMFKETVRCGSLSGEKPEVVSVEKKNEIK